MKKWSRHLLAAGALALGMSAAHADDNNTLYFYNWTEYVPPVSYTHLIMCCNVNWAATTTAILMFHLALILRTFCRQRWINCVR